MRQVGTIPDQGEAKKLADHLLTLGITTRLDPSPRGYVVWVHREERVDEARRELDAFLANPGDPKYQAAVKTAEVTRREMARREREHARKTINLQGRLNVISWQRCPVTFSLIAISVVVGFLTSLGRKPSMEYFLLSPPESKITMAPVTMDVSDGRGDPEYTTLMIPQRIERSTRLEAIERGQVWRLFTPMFLHLGYLHIIFNMIWLYQLGGLIELRKGRWALLALVLVSSAVSNLGEYFWELHQGGPDALVIFGGMSGVVYALFGYAWMKSDYDPDSDIKIPTNTIVWMIGWMVLCMVEVISNVANAAHLVGLIVGMAIGLAPHLLRRG